MNEEKCKVCGCTNDKACDGGCWWVAKELCSKCANKLIEENVKLKKQLEKLEEKYINNVPCCNEEDCEMFKDYMNLKQQLKDKDEKISKAKQYLEKNFYYCLSSGDDVTHYIDELCDYLYDNIKDIKIIK